MAELKCFMGTLTLSENNYGVKDIATGEIQSITDELERIHNSNLNIVRVMLRIVNSDHSINRMGSLYMGTDKQNIKGWFIGSYPLDKELRELSVDSNMVEISIEDFILTSVSEAEAYVS